MFFDYVFPATVSFAMLVQQACLPATQPGQTSGMESSQNVSVPTVTAQASQGNTVELNLLLVEKANVPASNRIRVVTNRK